MMLVSSSGWAHSPITLIFTALSAVYGAALGAGAAPSSTAKAATRTTPNRLTSLLPPRSHLFARLRTRNLFPAFRLVSSFRRLPSVSVRYAVLIFLAAALLVPASAHAAPKLGVTLSKDAVRYGASAHGQRHAARRHRRRSARQEVVLEGRRYPYEGSYRVIARTTTDADGQVPVQARAGPQPPAARHRARPGGHVQGRCRPTRCRRSSCRFRALRPGVVRLYQRYTVPTTVRLTSPDAVLSRPARGQAGVACARAARVKRSKAGRYTSQVDVTLPDELARRVPLRELLPPLAGHRDGRPGREVPEAAASRSRRGFRTRRRSKLIEVRLGSVH